MKKNKNSIDKALLLILFALGLAPFMTRAADSSWNVNAAGNWSAGTNWTAGDPGSTSITNSTDVATFAFTLTAARTVTVDTNRNIGGIVFGNTSNFGYTLSGGNLLLSSGGSIENTAGNGNHQDLISSAIAIQGNGSSATYAANASSSSSILRISGITTGVSTAGNTTTLYLDGSNTAANTIAGAIQDGAEGGNTAVVKNGTGTWILGGGNSFTGGLTVNNGILRAVAGSNNALGAGSSTLTLNGGELQLASNVNRNYARGTTVSNNSTIISDRTSADAGLTFSLATLSIGANTLTISGGSNVTSGTAGITFTGAVTLTGAATFNVVNNGDSTTLLTLNNTLDNGGYLVTFEGTDDATAKGIVSGTGGLTKADTGTLKLEAANTYSGGTTLSAGTLLAVNSTGSATGSGDILVGASGTLGGDGIIAPDAGNNVSVSGTLSPGDNDETTLNFDLSGASKLDFASGSSLEFTLGTVSDSIAFTTSGDWLSGSGNVTLDLSLGTGFDYGDTYVIFANATTTDFTLAGVTGYDTVSYTHSFTQSGSDYVLSFTMVPEPRAVALLGVAGLALFLRRQRA